MHNACLHFGLFRKIHASEINRTLIHLPEFDKDGVFDMNWIWVWKTFQANATDFECEIKKQTNKQTKKAICITQNSRRELWNFSCCVNKIIIRNREILNNSNYKQNGWAKTKTKSICCNSHAYNFTCDLRLQFSSFDYIK